MDRIMNVFVNMLNKSMKPMPNHCIDCDKPIPESKKVMCELCEDKTDKEIKKAIRSIFKNEKDESNGKD